MDSTLTTKVIMYKGKNEMNAVSGTPGDNEYKVTITDTVNCTAEIDSDNKTIKLTSVSSNSGQIKVSVNVENVKTYDKTISVASITDKEVINNVYSQSEQLADKFTWIVSSGTSQSNMTLTDEMYSLISNNITLTADHINLNGYVSNDDCNWSIDTQGNIGAKNLSIEGEISAEAVTCNKINNPNFPPSLVGDMTIYIDSVNGAEEIEEVYDGAVFQSISRVLDVMPNNLNNHSLYIQLLSNTVENVDIMYINTGRLIIQLNGYVIKGHVNIVQNMGLQVAIYGGTTASTSDTRGAIMPSVGKTRNNTDYCISVSDVFSFACYNVDFFVPKVVSSTYTGAIYISNYTRAYLNNIQAIHSGSFSGFNYLVRAFTLAYIYVAKSSGLVSKYSFTAESGSEIVLNPSGTQCGVYNSTTRIEVASGGRIYNSGSCSFDSSGTTGTSSAGTTTTQTKTKTFKSNYGDNYRAGTGWKNDGTARQGNYGYGDCQGCWFFGSQFSTIKGKKITKITLTITRQQGGLHAAVPLVVKSHNHSVRPSGAPSYNYDCGTLTIPINTTGTVTITNSNILTALSNGTIKGFGIKSVYNSANYAVCSGSLTVKVTYTE